MTKLTEQEIDQFNRDGYLMKPALFDAEEMELLITIAKNDQRLEREALKRRDAHAGTSKLWLTDVLEDDIYSAFVRCLRIVEPMEQVLGGEVYHYHHKMMLKEPFVRSDAEEMELLITIAKNDQRLEREALKRRDAHAGTSKLWLTDVLEDDIYSAFVRCLRIVEPMEQVLGGEVYHYHHKMMLKEPFV